MLRIPYTHSGVLASALAANKEKAKIVIAAAGIPVPRRQDRLALRGGEGACPAAALCAQADFGRLVLWRVHRQGGNLASAAGIAAPRLAYGDLMLAEKFIAGRELTCAVMGDRALGVTEIKAVSSEWYDFDSKYAPGGSIHELPAKVKENIYQLVQDLALKAHRALGCRGMSRTDFRYDDRPGGTGELVVLEVNTQPGMTETSLAPEMAAYAGVPFGELVKWMVEDASCDR